MIAMGAAALAAVTIGFGDYDPPVVRVLVGDTVTWSNGSARRHTVTADDGGFGSTVLYQGDAYDHEFDTAGVATYHCEQHALMRGEVDVERVLLDAPRTDAAPGRAYPLTGRAALPEGAALTVEADAGSGFAPAGSATVQADGSFTASVTPSTSARYRAVTADGAASPPVQLLVTDHAVTAAIARHHRVVAVRARVTPAAPRLDVVLQLRLKRRFGWWPVRHARLGPDSTARFTVRTRHAVQARVLLTLPDRATALAVSPNLYAKRLSPIAPPRGTPGGT